MTDNYENELWDVYTKEREKTGRLHCRRDKMKDGEYHLVVHVCIFNSRNQLLVQQRQPFKSGWPNMWDLTVGGSAIAGDSSSQAAEREVYEELGIRLDLSDKRPLFTINFCYGFDDYYFIEKDIDISELRFQKEEVRAVKWADKDEVLKMQEQGIMIPYWFLDKIFDIRNTYDVHGEQSITYDFATVDHLESWMSLVEIVHNNFPGLETEEQMADYRCTVEKYITGQSAICAMDGKMVVGILIFSTVQNRIECMAVHPDYRRQGIATKMIELMMPKLNQIKDIVVETFRRDDEKGIAPRALYQKLGFEPGELSVRYGSAVQIFRKTACQDMR